MYKLLLLPLVLLSSCSNYIDPTTYGIVDKQRATYEPSFCMYTVDCPNKNCFYTDNEFNINLKDSCNKFKIGDTIILSLSKKN